MKRVLLYTVACLASLTARYAEAQVPIGQVQAFSSAAPAVTSFSSKSVGGVGGTYATVALIDPDIQTNTAASINTALIPAAAAAPGGNGIAQWSSGGGYVLTRPTGNGFTILMATVTNNTGGSLSSVVISYVLGLPSVLAGEDAELQGHRVFYSTTGAANSWTLIPGLTSPQGPNPIPAGSLLATVSIGTLPVNGLLYIIWVDDNGGPGTDGSFSIDNFLVSTSIACPTVTTQPSNTTNAVGRTVSLSVVASGPGLTYAWNKVGSGPIDTTANPSAATPTLVINNADTSVTGDYFVAIANTCGSVNSANAHIQVNADTVPPRFLSASATGTRSFRLVVDEPLCVDPRPLDQGGCLADARDTFNWQIIDGTDLVTDLGVVTATVVDGTNVDFTVNTDRVPSKGYRITIEPTFPGDIRDTLGNQVTPGTYIETLPSLSFKQGVNGYTGVEDTELENGTANGGPDVPHGTTTFILVDKANAGGESQAMVRYNNMFGSSLDQIPLGATIVSATLVMQHTQANANGDPVRVYRMLVPWSQATATWNNFVNGITNDGVEAMITPDFSIISSTLTVPFTLNIDCTTSVQAWANGEPNYGWGFINDGGDGYRFDSSGVSTGPELRVEFRINPCTTAPSISGQPPATASGIEGGSVSVTVGVSTCGTTTYTWLKGALPGTPVAGANGPTLNLVNLIPSDAGLYRLRVTNPNGSATSDPTTVSVAGDTSRPVLTRAVSTSSTSVVLSFNKQLNTASAQLASHYVLSGGATVSLAVLANGANSATVTLTTSTRSLAATTLTITGVTDNRASLNPINPNPTIVVLTGSSVVAGAGWADTWQFNSNNLDSTSGAWKNTSYVPGADWGSGPALFGSETGASLTAAPAPIGTALTPNSVVATSNLLVTTYFRKSITLPALPAGAQYVICHYTDDGHITYLDGTEIYRFGMPSGAVTFTNRSSGIPTGEATMRSFSFTATPGTHTLAVELHQAGGTSSDVLFGMEVHIVGGPSPALSVSHTAGGPVNLNWTADSAWRLRGAAGVAGPYLDVAIPAGSLPGTFSLPSISVTNHNFWLLDYICP